MVDCDIVSRIMVMAGLDQHSVSVIMTPIKRAVGHWRLPRSEIGPFFVVERGVPQGMSISVLASELFIAVMLWKMTLSLPVEVVAYVDDINVITDDPHTLSLAITQLKQYEQTFCLQVATSKSFLWGSDEVALQHLSAAMGLS